MTNINSYFDFCDALNDLFDFSKDSQSILNTFDWTKEARYVLSVKFKKAISNMVAGCRDVASLLLAEGKTLGFLIHSTCEFSIVDFDRYPLSKCHKLGSNIWETLYHLVIYNISKSDFSDILSVENQFILKDLLKDLSEESESFINQIKQAI